MSRGCDSGGEGSSRNSGPDPATRSGANSPWERRVSKSCTKKYFSLESKILFQSYKQYTNEFYREDVNREVEEIFLPESKNWVWTRIKNTYVRKKMTMTASSSLFLLNQYPVSERVETLNRKTCHKQHYDISKVEQRRYRSCIYRQACFWRYSGVFQACRRCKFLKLWALKTHKQPPFENNPGIRGIGSTVGKGMGRRTLGSTPWEV